MMLIVHGTDIKSLDEIRRICYISIQLEDEDDHPRLQKRINFAW